MSPEVEKLDIPQEPPKQLFEAAVGSKIGRFAVCERGRVGRIDDAYMLHDGETILYVGTNMATGGPWQSVDPILIHEEFRTEYEGLVAAIHDLARDVGVERKKLEALL